MFARIHFASVQGAINDIIIQLMRALARGSLATLDNESLNRKQLREINDVKIA